MSVLELFCIGIMPIALFILWLRIEKKSRTIRQKNRRGFFVAIFTAGLGLSEYFLSWFVPTIEMGFLATVLKYQSGILSIEGMVIFGLEKIFYPQPKTHWFHHHHHSKTAHG